MQFTEKSRLFKLVSKEKQATEKMLDYGWTGIVACSLGITAVAAAGLERATGFSNEIISVTDDMSFVGLFVGIGSFVISGCHAGRRLAISDSLQTEQARNFGAMMASRQGKELEDVTDLIIQMESPDDSTSGWE
jgi:hypothetical protein